MHLATRYLATSQNASDCEPPIKISLLLVQSLKTFEKRTFKQVAVACRVVALRVR
jgi:hypothetical protein